jgi:hypothetical protein
MGKGRTIASIVALVLVIGLLGACGSSSKSKSAATRSAAQTKAAQAKIAAAQRRLAAAQLRVARQRRALAIAIRRQQAQARAAAARAATSTTTTTTPTVAPPKSTKPASGAATTTTTRPAPARSGDLATDTAAIAQTLSVVNAGFAKGVAAGIAASEAANYYISVGVYTDGECSAFEAARGAGLVSDHLVLQPGSVVPAPGFVDPILGAVPGGRIYALSMDDIQTQVSTQEQRTQSVSTHATVQPDGRALLFLSCK